MDIDRSVYFLLTLIVAVILGIVYFRYFDRMKPAIWIFPAILLWFGYRSLSGYFTVWAPVLVLGLMVEWKAQSAARANSSAEVEPVSSTGGSLPSHSSTSISG